MAMPPVTPTKQPNESVLVGQGYRTVVEMSFTLGPQLTWDGYWRLVYARMSAGIQRQADALLARGNISATEARALVESQRNAILKELRGRVSPFSRVYSEILKPSSRLPTLEMLVHEKGSIEAVLKSVGKTRNVVDRMGMVSRVGGPALIILQITMTAVVIAEAPEGQKGRVASREAGGIVGGASFGATGAWCGCVTAASLVTPSLFVPVWGEVTEAGACLVGGLFGGLGLGWAGGEMGKTAGENVYDAFTSEWTWV